MAAPRHVSPPKPVCSPRNLVSATQQADIDRILKDLKSCTRRLHAAFASHQVELQILEKLYYKGNNQHRTALFWRRVSDVRRFGKRLESVRILEHLETLRLTFWGDASQHSAKILKAAWTHAPDVKSVRHVLERSRDCLLLVDSMEEHLTKAHNHLNLDLQTGAFLQLILTLTAITSRMAILLTEIGPVVAQAWTTCYRLLETLTPGPLNPPSKFLGGRYKNMDPRRGAAPSRVQRSVSRPKQGMDKDLGDAVFTRENMGENIMMSTVVTSMVTSTEVVSQRATEEETVTVPDDLGFIFTQPQATASTVVRETVQRTIPKTRDAQSALRKRPATSAEKRDGQSKKKRKKKDEIDDIFGF